MFAPIFKPARIKFEYCCILLVIVIADVWNSLADQSLVAATCSLVPVCKSIFVFF